MDECPERAEGLPHEFQGEVVWDGGQLTRMRCMFCGRSEETYEQADDVSVVEVRT